MSMDLLLRDFIKCLVIFPVFFVVLLSAGLLKARSRRKKYQEAGPMDVRAELRRTLADKKMFLFFLLVAMFFAIYAVKNIVLRLIMVIIYVIFFLQFHKTDPPQAGTDSHGKE